MGRGWSLAKFGKAGCAVALAALLLNCHQKTVQVPLPISPSCTPSSPRVHPGDPVALEYRWSVGPGAPLVGKGFGAFVHFVDASGTLIFTDDHVPVPPPEAWVAGQTYTYKRVVLLPDLAPAGALEIRMGLFQAGGRLALTGRGARNEYAAGQLEVTAPEDRAPLAWGDGFYPPEASGGDPFTTRRWMRKEGRVSFRNHGRDVVVILAAETNHTFPETPVVTLQVGSHGVRLPVTSPAPFLERLLIRGRDLGTDRYDDLVLTMSHSFVPRLLGLGDDPRELALWIRGLTVREVLRLDPAVAQGADEAVDLGVPPKST